jgi:dynein heavy chain
LQSSLNFLWFLVLVLVLLCVVVVVFCLPPIVTTRLSQLRYFWQDRNCIMRVCDAEFLYSFEFIGNPGRLVITPLTDRCYITLTQALRLIMGGAPAGPAGTGKTETTKDLGRGLAVPVYVFNCSSQMNIYTLGDIFKGLCQTGGWGCFDEFNRIALEVLSVVSAQVMTILQALKAKQTRFDFMSENIRIFNTVGMFITMNPGYAGRTELPESLKALFRPCAMVVPDFTMICENMLLSEGFLLARIMAKKMVTLYRLGGDLLSKQAHYDWGLRAFKSVLRIAGGLKRADPTFSEDMVMLRALRDFNLPKIVDEDKVIFVRIINDLFPGIDLPPKVDPAFNEWVKKCAIILRLQPEETFVRKVANLKELLGIRHSVFTIGPAGAGKSEVFRTLLDVYNAIEKNANPTGPKTALLETINPKAVTSNELFGYKTAEWHDGVLSVVMRDMARNNPPYTPNQKVKWVVLDGDIDPEWIESLNTVMDDNKVLTLVSNERIPLTPAMRMMFEISNLKYATPATVSRAGILFISERDIGWKPFVDTWIQCRGEVGDKEKDKEKVILNNLFNKYVKNQEHVESYRKLGSGFKYITPISEVQMVQTICRMMEALTEEIAASRTSESTAAQEKESYELAMVFACIWAYGGSLYVEKGIGGNQREIFSNMWRSTFNTVKFEPGLVFDFYPDFKQNKFLPWTNKLPKYVPGGEEQLLVSNIYVPTVDTFRLTHMINLFAKNRRPVLFVGNAGTGKTTIVREYLRNLSMDSWLTATINFNSFTDSGILQNTMEQYVSVFECFFRHEHCVSGVEREIDSSLRRQGRGDDSTVSLMDFELGHVCTCVCALSPPPADTLTSVRAARLVLHRASG